MKNSMRGFIDPYSLGFVVIIIGALNFGIQDSFETSDSTEKDQQVVEQQEGDNADSK